MSRVIHLHVEAPAKPALGATCNGCGVCCAAEPCPVGMVLSLKRRGACRMLRWSGEQTRYFCGALTGAPRALQPLLRRWIASGRGCDSDLEPTGMP
ncbi:MAG: hypothetical protein JO006_05105 [Paucibacter sp.]|nr:hypothetical protein [Roseateles sp.]